MLVRFRAPLQQVVLANSRNGHPTLVFLTTGWLAGNFLPDTGIYPLRGRVLHDLFWCPTADHLATINRRHQVNIDNIVGCHHLGFFVMFPPQSGVLPRVPHLRQRLNETGVITLVETDRRLIKI